MTLDSIRVGRLITSKWDAQDRAHAMWWSAWSLLWAWVDCQYRGFRSEALDLDFDPARFPFNYPFNDGGA